MPSKLSQPHYRQRRQAINRKLCHESEMLMEAEPFEVIAPVGKPPVPEIGSPISIASSFEERLPEIQPIVLPGAWVVVGAKGKPIRREKMYDEPKKKKPRRKRTPKPSREVELIDLEEGPSAYNCLRAYNSLKAPAHEKEANRSLTAKHWARYRQQKQGKERAHAILLAALNDQGLLDGVGAFECTAPAPLKAKNHDGNTRRERVRRAARLAAAHERCYWPEADDEWLPIEAPAPSKPKEPRPVKQARFKAHNEWFPDEPKAPISRDSWVSPSLGKALGKAKVRATASGHQLGQQSSSGSSITEAKAKAKKSAPAKCSMM